MKVNSVLLINYPNLPSPYEIKLPMVFLIYDLLSSKISAWLLEEIVCDCWLPVGPSVWSCVQRSIHYWLKSTRSMQDIKLLLDTEKERLVESVWKWMWRRRIRDHSPTNPLICCTQLVYVIGYKHISPWTLYIE